MAVTPHCLLQVAALGAELEANLWDSGQELASLRAQNEVGALRAWL